MAAGDTLVSIPPQDFFPDNTLCSGGEYGLVTAGVGKGLIFRDGATGTAWVARRMPATAAFATGATFKLLVSDDPLNPAAGLVAKFGINVGLLGDTSTAKPFDGTNLGTEATATVTLPATSGQTKEITMPIVIASMASAAANKWCVIRIRRLGADSADTATGNVVLHGVVITDT